MARGGRGQKSSLTFPQKVGGTGVEEKAPFTTADFTPTSLLRWPTEVVWEVGNFCSQQKTVSGSRGDGHCSISSGQEGARGFI